MSKLKIAFFFGAGAEVPYGLPAGGQFALDIFRSATKEVKEQFKQHVERLRVSDDSEYRKWLVGNGKTKNTFQFGTKDYESIVRSTLEHHRQAIIEYLDDFDRHAKSILSSSKQSFHTLPDAVSEAMTSNSDKGTISINKRLSESANFFETAYFSAFARAWDVQQTEQEKSTKYDLAKIVRALVGLYVGSLGHELVSQLNEQVIHDSRDWELLHWEDGLFSIDIQQVVSSSIRLILEHDQESQKEDTPTFASTMYAFGIAMLEDIVSRFLNYESLIDEYYRYLYSPTANWAKFTKIGTFLYNVQSYINNQAAKRDTSRRGYYDDLVGLAENVAIQAIGTSNYTPICQQIVNRYQITTCNVAHLNGSVDQYYDPYTNTIHDDLTEEQRCDNPHLLVPFLFTQSGIKPLTSIEISRVYVELYDNYQSSDIVCIIGYAFNGDDGHINGMFRQLIVDSERRNSNFRLVIFHYEDGQDNLTEHYRKKLKLPNANRIVVLPLDSKRNSGDQSWWEALQTIQ